ncbi:Os10g0465175 [Oryza sativa Japonica Group]|uniref:Os10g0465175 protein n=1 Tax=Oryza sativa subsp. japonica TaxID=39947 RepID=A0A0P0XV16_ORYSJ|nr:hypothetical protein EE612_051725 [Oryza sativa]BAT11204.1 Os10g0465175 [Oryza sativa Japonica Group]
MKSCSRLRAAAAAGRAGREHATGTCYPATGSSSKSYGARRRGSRRLAAVATASDSSIHAKRVARGRRCSPAA